MTTRSATFVGRLHVVRHDDARHRVAAAGAQNQFVDHVAHDRVQAGRRLVVEHDLRLQGQGPGQADAFPHAAGKLGRLLEPHVLRQADLGQPRHDDLVDFRGGSCGCAAAGERPRSGRSSCCRTGPPAERRSRSGSAAGPSPARSAGPGPVRRSSTVAARRPHQADDRLQEHGLAATALADDGQRLPRAIERLMSRSTSCRRTRTPSCFDADQRLQRTRYLCRT